MRWMDGIGRRIKLRDLHRARGGGRHRAAEELAVSYPVVFKIISELEHALDGKLFDCDSFGVEPTYYGRALLDRKSVV